MHYMCESCEQIYADESSAEDCCPNPIKEIPDDQVMYCPHCSGDGCDECHDNPIRLKREVECDALPRVQQGRANDTFRITGTADDLNQPKRLEG